MSAQDLLFRISTRMEADPGLPATHPTSAFWQSPPHDLSATRSEQLPEAATTVVIGSGITACSLVKALLEKDANANIVVCEARSLVSGATGRNGGHLVSSAVAGFSALQHSFGTDTAVKIASFTLANVERIFDVAKELGPQVERASELRRVDKVLALRDVEAVENLRGSLQAFEENMPEQWKGQLKLIGKDEMEKEYKLRNIVGGAIAKGGALWPYRLITHTWSSLLEKYPNRLRIETWTPITSVTSSTSNPQHPYLLHSPRGTIAAAEVVYCTNGHTGHLIPRLRGVLFPLRGTMTVQDCGPSFPRQGDCRTITFYGAAKLLDGGIFDLGLHYAQQNAATGDVFIGGETANVADLLNSDDGTISARSLTTLENAVLPAAFAPEIWQHGETDDGQGNWPKVKGRWSGIMGFTADGVPLVGRLPEAVTGRRGRQEGESGGGEWIAAGFNGYGMANCWLSGEALAGMMRGEDVSAYGLPDCYLATAKRLTSLNAHGAAERLFGC